MRRIDPAWMMLNRRHLLNSLAGAALVTPCLLRARGEALRVPAPEPGALAPARARGDAVDVEGHSFVRRTRVSGSELMLNGTGVRAVGWLKGYAAGLYLGRPCATAAQAVALAGPKRLQLCMLHDVPAAEFAKAFRKGMARNADADTLARLDARMNRFAARIHAMRTLRKGDVVTLDHDPDRGMLFSLNGKPQGEAIAGADFYAVLLLSFVGERPYDRRLKAGLLGARG